MRQIDNKIDRFWDRLKITQIGNKIDRQKIRQIDRQIDKIRLDQIRLDEMR